MDLQIHPSPISSKICTCHSRAPIYSPIPRSALVTQLQARQIQWTPLFLKILHTTFPVATGQAGKSQSRTPVSSTFPCSNPHPAAIHLARPPRIKPPTLFTTPNCGLQNPCRQTDSPGSSCSQRYRSTTDSAHRSKTVVAARAVSGSERAARCPVTVTVTVAVVLGLGLGLGFAVDVDGAKVADFWDLMTS